MSEFPRSKDGLSGGGSGGSGLSSRRRAIEALDGRILRLVVERMEEAERIAEIKADKGIPMRNFEVEARVILRLEALSAELGKGESLGRAVAEFLISQSLKTQSPILETAYEGDRLRTVVVGGMGGMGRWVSRFLNGQGHAVTIVDPAPGETPFERAGDLQRAALSADLVMVAVPMGSAAEVLEELASLEPPCVVAEMCSFKTHLRGVFESCRKRGLRLVSFHPLFGPGVAMLSGRKIILCTEGAEKDRALVKGLFHPTSARIVEMNLVEHDRRMAVVLGLVHLANLVLARSLSRCGLSFEDLDAVGGVTFDKQVKTTREVAGENPALYFDIQGFSKAAVSPSSILGDSLEEIRGFLSRGDGEAFSALMAEAASFLAVPGMRETLS